LEFLKEGGIKKIIFSLTFKNKFYIIYLTGQSVMSNKKENYKGTLKKIIEAAKSEFAKRGFFKTTVEKITKKAGVAKGTYYLYFKTKEDVIKYIVDEMTDEIARILDVAINSLKSNPVDFKNFFRVLLNDSLSAYLNIKDAMITVFRSNYELSRQLASFKSESINKLRNKVREILSISIEKSYIRKVNIDIYTDILFMLMTNFFFEIVLQRKEEDYEYYIDNIIDFILYGLKKG
jgi:AcrR family transcriptional regulator